MTTMIEGEVLHRDVFPAEVSLRDGAVILTSVRVFVTSHRLLVFAEADDGNQDVIRTRQVLDLELARVGEVDKDRGSLFGRIEVKYLDDGGSERTAWVNRGGGCGCHSPLKVMRQPVGWR